MYRFLGEATRPVRTAALDRSLSQEQAPDGRWRQRAAGAGAHQDGARGFLRVAGAADQVSRALQFLGPVTLW